MGINPNDIIIDITRYLLSEGIRGFSKDGEIISESMVRVFDFISGLSDSHIHSAVNVLKDGKLDIFLVISNADIELSAFKDLLCSGGIDGTLSTYCGDSIEINLIVTI